MVPAVRFLLASPSNLFAAEVNSRRTEWCARRSTFMINVPRQWSTQVAGKWLAGRMTKHQDADENRTFRRRPFRSGRMKLMQRTVERTEVDFIVHARLAVDVHQRHHMSVVIMFPEERSVDRWHG